MSFLVKSKTALSLGLFNLWRVAKYRLGIKIGLNPVQKLSASLPSGSFFSRHHIEQKNVDKKKSLTAFGRIDYPLLEDIPNWFYSPLTQKKFTNVQLPWYQLPDFVPDIGDIKGVWEASRLDWIFDFIRKEQRSADGGYLVQLDEWLNNWCIKNPAYFGPNWKCGQEASIRVMHIIAALIGLNKLEGENSNLRQFVEVHLKRIEPTIDYAIAQDNNHGTSEAVALYIGGAWLYKHNPQTIYKKWQDLGLKWLENRAHKLIMADGGFSQYSVNYHRVMLDSYCLAEIVRRKLGLSKFSDVTYHQLGKATNWLYVLTQDDGDAPNLGANDGARLIPVTETDYRDFRPSVQLASTLFCAHSYYQEFGDYDVALSFFKLEKLCQSNKELPSRNQFFSESGLITAQHNDFFIVFKLPIFKFRPSQSDALHIDLWWQGINILRDGGTYSYNTTKEDLDYFSGVASHNTIQFDAHQQMPRLSRFLFGEWLKPLRLYYNVSNFRCAYKDYLACQHIRSINLLNKEVQITDEISGFKDVAILRWRLQPGDWELEGKTLTNGLLSITIQSSDELSLRLTTGEESRYYYQKTRLPVLEVITSKASKIITSIKDLT